MVDGVHDRGYHRSREDEGGGRVVDAVHVMVFSNRGHDVAVSNGLRTAGDRRTAPAAAHAAQMAAQHGKLRGLLASSGCRSSVRVPERNQRQHQLQSIVRFDRHRVAEHHHPAADDPRRRHGRVRHAHRRRW